MIKILPKSSPKLQEIIASHFQIIDTSTKNIDYPAKIKKNLLKNIDTSAENIDTSTENIDTLTEIIDSPHKIIDTSTKNIDHFIHNIDHFFKKPSKIRCFKNRSDTYVL